MIEELIGLGARRLVRVGSCGALGDGLALGDLVVAGEALAEDGTSRALGAGRHADADPALASRLGGLVGAAAGAVVSTDLFYAADAEAEGEARARWRAAGARAVEMECAALFTLGALRGVAAGAVLAVSDVLGGGRGPGADRRRDARGRGAADGRDAVAALGRDDCLTALALDGHALLAARRGGVGLGPSARGPRSASAVDLRLDRREALLDPRGAVEILHPGLDAVEPVLDALEALRDRAQAAGQALEVGGGREVERAHRHLLGLGGLLASLERA